MSFLHQSLKGYISNWSFFFHDEHRVFVLSVFFFFHISTKNDNEFLQFDSIEKTFGSLKKILNLFFQIQLLNYNKYQLHYTLRPKCCSMQHQHSNDYVHIISKKRENTIQQWETKRFIILTFRL